MFRGNSFCIENFLKDLVVGTNFDCFYIYLLQNLAYLGCFQGYWQYWDLFTYGLSQSQIQSGVQCKIVMHGQVQ
jgi:hypothetical protein